MTTKKITVDEVLQALNELGNVLLKLDGDVQGIASRMNELEIRLQKIEDERGK